MNAHKYGIFDFGSVEMIRCQSLLLPPIQNGFIRLRMISASINPIDVKTRAGFGFVAASKRPKEFLSLGYDVYGEIIDASEEAKPLIGKCAFGMTGFPNSPGTYADVLDVPVEEVFILPEVKQDIDLGGLSLAGLTAMQALQRLPTHLPLYVSAPTGGVGHLAIQIARILGYNVTAVTRRPDNPMLSQLSARLGFNVISFDTFFAEQRQGALLDLVGGDVAKQCLDTLLDGSIIVTVPTITKDLICSHALSRNVEAVGVVVQKDVSQLACLYDWYKRGELTLHIAERFLLQDVNLGHQMMESGDYSGKLLIVANHL
ncbi:zinc-binding dehydrogenase [Pseudoalteromonas xiamenensis]|uniref:zinc-binding dehydrogenase n=1 Tax=Pseudoalteromonas xiamenensis TaxID=882626 RepID=UPI0027E40EB0|nr:zinc-binding dehydrogenase [Pseudoalteromonas xiamenensis]WMN60306.1 zinc-binding dehydrogenase [Pseudoalteromonas xiamenensis]